MARIFEDFFGEWIEVGIFEQKLEGKTWNKIKFMDAIKQIKFDIKIALSEDIDKTIDKFNAVISAESGLFDEFILLVARYRHIRNESLRNTVSVVDESIELAKIRGGFIKIINEIADEDLDNDKKKACLLVIHQIANYYLSRDSNMQR